jgi:hypothetical protein
VLQGVRNGCSGPPISHIFTWSDTRNVQAFKDTLFMYFQRSGHKINMEKSSVFFGLHCEDHVKLYVMTRLEVINEALQETFLYIHC